MAPNKFATMLRRKSNRFTFVLVYAVLEWALIFFLLLNSLFSFLIIKFANYFGLKPPCLLCSRLDHVLDPQNSNPPYKDLICEQHAIELSKLGFCFSHRTLVGSSLDMCEKCSLSPEKKEDRRQLSMGLVFRWLKEAGFVKSNAELKGVDHSDVKLPCCCCGVVLEQDRIEDHPVIAKPSSRDAQNVNLIANRGFDDTVDLGGESNRKASDNLSNKGGDEVGHGFESSRDIQMSSDINFRNREDEFSFCVSKSGYSLVEADESERDELLETEREPLLEESTLVTRGPYYEETILTPTQHLDFYVGLDDHRLIPVELVDDLEGRKCLDENKVVGGEGGRLKGREESTPLCKEADHNVGLGTHAEQFSDDIVKNLKSFDFTVMEETDIDSVSKKLVQEKDIKREVEDAKKSDEPMVESFPTVDEVNSVTDVEADCDDEASDATLPNNTKYLVIEEKGVPEVGSSSPSADAKDLSCMKSDDTDALKVEVPITNVPVVETSRPLRRKVPSTSDAACQTSFSFAELLEDNDCVSRQSNEEVINLGHVRVEIIEQPVKSDSFIPVEPVEGEEDRLPDTPTSLESLNHLHIETFSLGRKASMTTNEESLDGSMVSELEVGDGSETTEHLKAELIAKRKALHALYKELEEERNASAAAADHTMAMINRLQEEKAAIEMEASQYHRMMDEQAEYDQEALEMMNEILVRREKENHELEKELEEYRVKVVDYEKEIMRMKMLVEKKDRAILMQDKVSSPSCSNGGDSDGLSVDPSNDPEGEEILPFLHKQNGNHLESTPIDTILSLQNSLCNDDDERMSILDQLRVLEEKLCLLAEEEDNQIGSMKPFEQFYEENAKDFETTRCEVVNGEPIVLVNGSSKVNGKHHQEKRLNGSEPKQLLPLFDAATLESDDELLATTGIGAVNGDRFHPTEIQRSPSTMFELEKKRIDIEDEVDHIYGRLQALEADREFIKHCVGSLRKGDRGISLLQEILQHLRELKNVDTRARNLDDEDNGVNQQS